MSGVVGGEQAIWLAEVLGKRGHSAVDDVGNYVTSASVQSVSTQCRRAEAGVKRRNITRDPSLDIHDGSLQALYTSVNFKLDTSQFFAICTLHYRSNARFHRGKEAKGSMNNTKVI